MSHPSIAVCVACFFGPRTRHWEDENLENPALSHVLRQVRYLDEYTVSATRISFVVSLDLDGIPEDEQVRANQKKTYDEFCLIVEAKNASDPNRSWEVLQRPNLNISYGAWKWYLDGVCSDIDYVYLLEDDYSPAFKGYDVEVIDRVFTTPEARSTIVKACSIPAKLNIKKRIGTIIKPPPIPKKPAIKPTTTADAAITVTINII